MNMKKWLLLLLMLMQTVITFSSSPISSKIVKDSTIVITLQQLKETNVIFIEHSKLLTENNLLKLKISRLEQLFLENSKIDSLHRIQLGTYESMSAYYNNKFLEYEKKSRKTDKIIHRWKLGCFTISSSLLLLLLLK